MSKNRKIPDTIIQIVTLMGISVAAERNSLIDDLLSDGLENLSD